MNNISEYNYSEEQRRFIETSVIPFAFFIIKDSKVKTILVSDGLCRLIAEDRQNAYICLENDIYNYIHNEDVDEVKRKCNDFFFNDGELNTSFRIKLKPDSQYHSIYLSGKRLFSNTGEPMFVLWYNYINIKQYDTESIKEKENFKEFLKGEANDLPFSTFGYKGYSVWNITIDKMISESSLGYSSSLLGDNCSYSEYYSLNKGWLIENDDIEYFSELSPENIKKNFEKFDVDSHIFTFGSSMGQISVKITPSVSIKPETGEIYLKLQAENVTDSVVYETMVYSSAKTSEFMAHIDGNSGNVYFIDKGIKTKYPLDEMLPIFSANFGYNFKNSYQVLKFIEYKCGRNSNATIINRVSKDCIKSIRLEIINKDEKQYFICGSDVTPLINLKVNSYYDDLTGLPNMSAFRIISQEQIKKMRNESKTPALVYFDVRDMKAINEKYSFECGNSILSNTAYVLRNVFSGDPVSRLAEDHFVVLSDRKSLEQRIETVHNQILKNPIGIPVQICAGIYIDNGHHIDIDSMCDRARLACKTLKGDYNRKYKIFDNNMFDEYHKRRYILSHFDEALENGYIKVYYQPIIRCLTGNVCDMEALCRWEKPDRGVVQPSQFISVLEEHRLIYKLDFYMLKKICEDLDMLRHKNFPLIPVSVNISRINFEMCDVVEEVLKIVDGYRIPHKLLTIEITESAFIHNPSFLNGQINRFREAGFDVWMDDFGSEYSSLNTLQEFTFDLIKLDMKFMKNFSTTGKNFSILSDVISMVSKLGIHTLAEGVQSKEQLHFLRDIGCEKAQGFLFSHPMTIDYFMEKYYQNTGLGYDDVSMSEYYEKIGSIRLDNSLLSEHKINIRETALTVPAAVVEYRNNQFKILKANQEYKNFFEKIGFGDVVSNNEYKEWDKQPSHEFTRAAIKCLVTNGNESISNDIENGYIVSAKLICISYNYSMDTGAFIVIIEKYKKNI